MAEPYLPATSAGDDAVACSKYGGTPWLEPSDVWPICDACAQPMRFVLQLARRDVPTDVHWAFDDDLIELFFCDSHGKPGDPWWACQSAGGWEPFAATTVIRHVQMRSGPASVREAIPLEALEVRRRAQCEVMAFYADRIGDHALAESWRARIDSERVTPAAYVVPTSRIDDSLLYPAARVTGWRSLEDAPDVDPDHRGDHLGGDPMWLHGEERIDCRACASPMKHLLQIASDSLIPLAFGRGDGLAWVFSCPACRAATLIWQP